MTIKFFNDNKQMISTPKTISAFTSLKLNGVFSCMLIILWPQLLINDWLILSICHRACYILHCEKITPQKHKYSSGALKSHIHVSEFFAQVSVLNPLHTSSPNRTSFPDAIVLMNRGARFDKADNRYMIVLSFVPLQIRSHAMIYSSQSNDTTPP